MKTSVFGRSIAVLAAFVVAVFVLVGCTSSREYEGVVPTTDGPTTTSLPTDDELDADPSSQLQDIIDAALAADNVCDVLTEKAFAGLKIDDTALVTGPAAIRQTYEGMVEVFDHLITIAPPSLRQPLNDMRDITLQILTVLDRYRTNPNDSSATAAIAALTQSAKYNNARAALAQYATTSCPGA